MDVYVLREEDDELDATLLATLAVSSAGVRAPPLALELADVAILELLLAARRVIRGPTVPLPRGIARPLVVYSLPP